MSNVLCIEPNPLLARTYARAFEHAGYSVAVAHTAQGGIQAVDTVLPDLIVLELHLPDHDGIEFLHELRSYAEWQDIPVMLLTNADPATLEPLHAALRDNMGVVSYLYKPQAPLEKCIRELRVHIEAIPQVTV